MEQAMPMPDAEQAPATNPQMAFLAGMVPHHEMAIEMAKMAESKAKKPDVKKLAGAIIKAQTAEIDEMKHIHQRLFGSALQADMMAHEKLGLSMKDAGMDMDMKMLEKAADFDRAFLEQMVPHHQGAIRMAKEVLKTDNVDSEVAALANKIISAQQKEIEMINEWIARDYSLL